MKVPFLPVPKNINSNDHACFINGKTQMYTSAPEGESFTYLLGLAGIEPVTIEHFEIEGEGPLHLVLGDMAGKPNLTPANDNEEAYAMESIENTIVIAAHNSRGLAHGVKLLIRLYKAGMLNKGFVIQDYPDVPFRAVHMCIFNPDDGTEKDATTMEDVRRRAIVAALSGYNHIFLEFWGMFPYRRQPEPKWPKAWSWDEATGLINFILDDLHLVPCPVQNLTSHAGWSRLISRKHVMLDQHPQRANLYIQGGWCFTTENEDTRNFLRDIIDDLVEAYRNPPYIHCASDKCFGFGSSDEDRTHPADVLFVNHLCFLNDHISQNGSRMVMWSDSLYSSMDVLVWKCNPSTTNLLPKSILINIWTHNDPGNYWQDISFFEDKGFQTIYSPFFNRAGARSMVRLCKKHGSLGIMQTTWHRPELALPTIVFSGGTQWGDSELSDSDEVLNYCLSIYQE